MSLRLIFHRHFSPFRLFLNPKQHRALVLNPKVGTTFIRDTLKQAYAKFYQLNHPSEGRYPLIKFAREMPLAPVSEYYKFLTHSHRYTIFGVVRNPYQRIVSAWRDKFYDGHFSTSDHIADGYPRSIRKGVLRAVRKFARSRSLEGSHDKTLVPFSTFIDYVAAGKAGQRNHHWDLQCEVLMVDRLNYSEFFNIEQGLADPILAVTDRNSIPEAWVRERANSPINSSSIAKSPVITETLAQKIYQIYARDFEMFNLKQDSWQGL